MCAMSLHRALLLVFLFGNVVAGPLKLQESYPKQTQFVEDFTLHHKWDDKALHLAVVAKTTGWFGLGIGEDTLGTMKGSDMAIFTTENGKGKVRDMYALRFSAPMDDKTQDWKLVASSTNSTHSAYEVTRALDTKDGQDRAIPANGRVNFVFAMGKKSKLMYHGANRWVYTVDLAGALPNDMIPKETDLKTLSIRMGNYHVPKKDTVFGCKSFALPENMTEEAHLVYFEPHPDVVKKVHHLVVLTCTSDATGAATMKKFDKAQECGEMRGCYNSVFIWAQGRAGQGFPPEAGFPIAGKKSYASRYFLLNIHYNNPGGDAFVDDTSVTMTYTHQLRKYDAGIMLIGDLLTQLPNMPPKQPYMPFEVTCPSACTKLFDHPITVFSDFFHMHMTGSRMWTTIHHPDGTWEEIHRIDFWDYRAPRHLASKKFQINPGDAINLHCVYDTTERTNMTSFGQFTVNEMCFDIITYYPILMDEGHPYLACGSTAHPFFPGTDTIQTLCGSIFDRKGYFPTIENAPPSPEQRDPLGCHTEAFGIPGEVPQPVCKHPFNPTGLPEEAIQALEPYAKPCELFSCGKGTCKVSKTATYTSYCECPQGMSGLHCQTVSATVCAPSPCNGGKCQEMFGFPYCTTCPTGKHGTYCNETEAPPASKCDPIGLGKCMFSAHWVTHCEQYAEYSKCAMKHGCSDVVKIWCGSIMDHKWACGTWEICDPLNTTPCNEEMFQSCVVAARTKNLKGCAYQAEYLKCAKYARCNDLTTYGCQRNQYMKCKEVEPECPAAATSSLLAEDKVEYYKQLDLALSYTEHNTDGDVAKPNTNAVVVVASAASALVVCLVGLAAFTFYKKRSADAELAYRLADEEEVM